MPKPNSGRKVTKLQGIMSEYHTENFGSKIDISFDNNAVRGEDTYVYVSNKATAADDKKR